MKTGNLKDVVLSDGAFKVYYMQKHNISMIEYDAFCESDMIMTYNEKIIELSNQYSINLIPYLFALSSLIPKAYFDILIFFNHYLTRAEMNSEVVSQYILAMHDKVHTKNLEDVIEIDPIGMTMEIIYEHELIMLSFLYVLQYLFL